MGACSRIQFKGQCVQSEGNSRCQQACADQAIRSPASYSSGSAGGFSIAATQPHRGADCSKKCHTLPTSASGLRRLFARWRVSGVRGLPSVADFGDTQPFFPSPLSAAMDPRDPNKARENRMLMRKRMRRPEWNQENGTVKTKWLKATFISMSRLVLTFCLAISPSIAARWPRSVLCPSRRARRQSVLIMRGHKSQPAECSRAPDAVIVETRMGVFGYR